MTISDAQHRLLLDNLTTATLLLNAELRLEYMNPAAEMLLAVSGQRSHGQFISELFTESTEALNSLRQAQDSGEFLTGLIYINEEKPDFISQLQMVEEPLATLPQAQVQPGEADVR